MKWPLSWISALVLAAFLLPQLTMGFEPAGSLDELYQIDHLARLRPGVVCKMFSSYDRTGGNDDGWSGKFSFLRMEDGDSVVAEMDGAGCIQRMWFTHSVHTQDGLLNLEGEHIRIYLDGAAEPAVDVPLEQLFSGELPAFPRPLVGSALGGFYCYVPIPYNNGCKVVIEGDGVKYYQITYNEFHHGKAVESFSMDMTPEKQRALDAASTAWSQPGILGRLGVTAVAEWTFRISAESGRPAVIELPDDAHIIRALTLTPAAAGQWPTLLRARLHIFWDNAPTPAVNVPLGFFFARADATAAFASLLAGERNGTLYNFFPMPYRRAARIEIQSDEPIAATLTIAMQNQTSLADDYAYLHVHYGEQLPTESGLFYPWLNIEGRGHFAGTFMATEGRSEQPVWLEGDEQFFIDGALVIHGTGTEDYFNCGWYALKNRLDTSGTLALHGYPAYGRRDGVMRADMYRWHVADPVPWQSSIHARIEHGRQNDVNADYRSAVFFYDANPEQRTSKAELPAGEEIVAYLGKRIWSMAGSESDPYAFDALEKLEQLKTEAGHADIETLIDGLTFYLEGAGRHNWDAAAAGLDVKITEAEAALARPAAAESLSTTTLTNIARILKRARFDLERHEARARGFQFGDELIIESCTPDGAVTPLPRYVESGDFRNSFAKVDDLRLLGTGARFTYGSDEASAFVRFTPDIPSDGNYRVDVIFSFGANAADTVYAVRHADGLTTISLAQRGRPGTPQRNNDVWQPLGTFRFLKGLDPERGSVTLVNPPGTPVPNPDIEYRAYADAIRFVYQGDTPVSVENTVNDDFESGRLDKWEIVSGQFHQQPAKAVRNEIIFNQQGDYFIGTAETGKSNRNDFDDTLTGVIRSRPFQITDNFISFLIGGGEDINNLYMALILAEDHSVIHKATGRLTEFMDRRFWEVSDFIGKSCYLEIVDNAQGRWGHINIDDIRAAESHNQAQSSPVVAAGEFFRIYNPSLGESKPWYINDHCFIADDMGRWHLFGITHEEPAVPYEEDNFAHATSDELTRFPWTKHPYALSVEEDPWNETVLWAPFVLRHDNTYYMFYCAGGESETSFTIHLATSPDLQTWERHSENPMVVDGYHARDPFVLRVGDEWVMYYTANSEPDRGNHVVAYRTSRDLVHWGERKIAFTDPLVGTYGGPTESPFVVRRGKYYYLFIGPRKGYVGTDVFQSEDPFHFELSQFVGHIAAHAAEVVRDKDGKWYISHCGWGEGGVYLAPLYWNDGQDLVETNIP